MQDSCFIEPSLVLDSVSLDLNWIKERNDPELIVVSWLTKRVGIVDEAFGTGVAVIPFLVRDEGVSKIVVRGRTTKEGVVWPTLEEESTPSSGHVTFVAPAGKKGVVMNESFDIIDTHSEHFDRRRFVIKGL